MTRSTPPDPMRCAGEYEAGDKCRRTDTTGWAGRQWCPAHSGPVVAGVARMAAARAAAGLELGDEALRALELCPAPPSVFTLRG